MKKIFLGVFLLTILLIGAVGCGNMGEKITDEYGKSPYSLVAFDRGQYISGEISGYFFLGTGGLGGSISGGTSILFAIETDSGIHMFNVPIELVSIILVDNPPYTAGFLISYDPMIEGSPAEIKGNTATYLVKKYAKECYIKISEKDFSNFIRTIP